MRGGLSIQGTIEYWSYQFEHDGLYQSLLQYENKMFFVNRLLPEECSIR